MIEFTIKTLDSNNHHFSVENEITIQQLKEKVREQMGIDIHLQRLIFCGRVMQDEQKLSEYDVNGKVVHLVQRAPPSPESRRTVPGNSARNVGGANVSMQQQIRRLMAMAAPDDFVFEQQHGLTLTPTAGRLELVRRMTSEIKASLDRLNAHLNGQENSGAPASSEAPVEPMENESSQGATNDEEALFDGMENLDENDLPTRVHSMRRRYFPLRERSYWAVRALRSRTSRPRDLAQLLEEIDSLQEQFAPHRARYVRLLRTANNLELTEEQRQFNQRTVDITTDIIHSFGHAYHAISDITFQVAQRNARLTSEIPVMTPPVPLQAHINVVQSSDRPPQNATSTVTSGAGNTGGAPGNEATPTDANNGNQETQEGEGNARDDFENLFRGLGQATGLDEVEVLMSMEEISQAGAERGPVNVRSAPAPATASAPVASPAPAASPAAVPSPAHVASPAAVASSAPVASPAAGASSAPVAALAAVASSAPVASPALVASPVPTASPALAVSTAPAVSPATAISTALTASPIFMSSSGFSFPGSAASARSSASARSAASASSATSSGSAASPSSLASTLRLASLSPATASPMSPVPAATLTSVPAPTEQQPNGIPLNNTNFTFANMPTSEAGAVLVVPPIWGSRPSAELFQNIVSSMIRQGLVPGMEGITVHATAHEAVLPQGQANNYSPVQMQQETLHHNTPQNTTDQAGQNSHFRQSNIHVRRAANAARAQAMPMSHIVYDRFLHCDSAHARRRLQRRRELFSQQYIATQRMRQERAAFQNIECLRDRAHLNITQSQMQTIVTLLNQRPSVETWLNAFMTAIARHLFITNMVPSSSGEPPLVPFEFRNVRALLRNYIEHVLFESGEENDVENGFETVADFLVDMHAEFLNGVPSLTPIRDNVDFLGSMRLFARSRLPAVLTCVMSDANGQAFVARFYELFARIFTDLCTLISYCCENRQEGLQQIFGAYMDYATQNIGEIARESILTLATINYNGIIANLPVHFHGIHRCIQFKDGENANDSALMEESEQGNNASPPNEPASISPEVAPTNNPSPVHYMTGPEVANIPLPPEPFPTASQAATPVIEDSQPKQNAQDALVSPPISSPRTPNSNTKKQESPCSGSGTTATASTVRLVSPVILIQNWEEEWVPMLSEDERGQDSEHVQEPYSDGYLTGMPARKRRCVRQSRPPSTLGAFLNESVNEAAERTTTSTVDTTAVREAFRDHMRNVARARASNSADYNSLRFASAARFINSPTPNDQDPADNGSSSS